MPGIVAHMSVAKLVGEKIGKNTPEFYQGNLLPDVIAGDKMHTHYKIQGKVFHIPDTDYYRQNHDLTKDINLGYYIHLLLDKYFMEEFIPTITKDRDVFQKGIIYEDYDNSNESLIQKYHLDVETIISFFKFSEDLDIDSKRLNKNIECFHTTGNNPTKVFTIEEFENFIEKSSNRIIQEIRQE